MDKKEKMALMEEVMDLEAGTLSENDKLSSYEEWDSLSVLAYMSAINSKFHKNVMPTEIKKLVTIADAIDLME